MGGEYILSLFWDLRSGLGSNGFERNPLAYLEIFAWSALTGTRLSPWELKALRAMDVSYREAVAEINTDEEGERDNVKVDG